MLDLLAALIDKSLVALEDELAGDARYRLLDTIREYAAARLAAAGEQEEFRRRHRDYLLQPRRGRGRAGVRCGTRCPGRSRSRAYYRIAAEQANFRAALPAASTARDAEKGLRLCSALRSPWVVQGDVTEGLGWFGRFLALDGWVPAGVRARALMLGAELAFEHQDYAGGRSARRPPWRCAPPTAAACPAGALRILALISLRAGLAEQALAQG